MNKQQIRLTPNGRGAQPYISRDILEDSACPLRQGQRCRATLIPGVGVLLQAANDETNYSAEDLNV